MIRTFLIALILATIAATPLVAQEATPASFFIERIEVRNAKRVSADVVIAESNLREGREYTEADLRDAANRLSRLPFLLSAEFSLEKGVERGRLVLVITLSETQPFFYMLDARPVFGEGRFEAHYSNNLSAGNEGLLGFRWFTGRHGAVHAGLLAQSDNREYTHDYGAFAIGYTQYDIFDTRAFVTLNLKYPIGATYGEGKLSPQIVAGIPLSFNQTLTLNYDQTAFEPEFQTFPGVGRLERSLNQRILTAKWSYNTTNHPFLPTHGTLLSVTPVATWIDQKRINRFFDGTGISASQRREKNRSLGLELSVARYWEISDRNSVSAGADGGWAEIKNDVGKVSYDSSFAGVHAGFSRSLWDRSRRKDGDSRIELDVRALKRNDEDRNLERDVVQATVAWVRRSSWGTIRLGTGYAW